LRFKDIILYPFIFVYKLVFYAFLVPILFIKNVILGFFYTLYYLFILLQHYFIKVFIGIKIIFIFIYKLIVYSFKGIYKFLLYSFKGIIYVFSLLGDLILLLIKGFVKFFKFLFKLFKKLFIFIYKFFYYIGLGIYKFLRIIIVVPIIYIFKSIGKVLTIIFSSIYKGIVKLFNGIKKLPKNFINKIKKIIYNSSVARYFRNKKEMQREALLIDFTGKDAERSEKLITYSYVAKDADGKIIKGTFDAYSKVDVHSYLLSEGSEVYSIKTSKWIQLLNSGSGISKFQIKKKDLNFMLTQLSTYIKAGVPLVESLKILLKQTKGNRKQRVFKGLVYELTMGQTLSDAMDKQGRAFPKLLTNMIKTAEMTGDLPGTLDDMAGYYESIEKTRKQMISALMYPGLVLSFAVIVVAFILIYVIPQFVDMFDQMNAEIPGITKFVISASKFMQANVFYVFLGIVVLFIIYRLLFASLRFFRLIMQWLFMHIPVLGKVIIYNEVTMFTKTFASLLNHDILIRDSMEILNKITKNEIYKIIISDTMVNLYSGESVSNSFKDQWAFPTTAYEMLLTGERTGELGKMMEKVADYYQEQHRLSVSQIKSFIEPVMISFLALVVGGIVMSIILPMFSMYGQI